MAVQIKNENREGQSQKLYNRRCGHIWMHNVGFWRRSWLVSVCPSKRWSHTMCLSDPDTAILIGGETAEQNYCKDSLWKLELGQGSLLICLIIYCLLINVHEACWLEVKLFKRLAFLTSSQTVTSGSPWTPLLLAPYHRVPEDTLRPMTQTLSRSLFTAAWGRVSATASCTSSILWPGSGSLSLWVCCMLPTCCSSPLSSTQAELVEMLSVGFLWIFPL